MSRTLLLNLADPEEHRAVLLENGRPSLYAEERADDRSLVGNIYKGRITHVEPSIGAAFVDMGLPRPGFLHADDVAGPGGARRRRGKPVEDLLRVGQEVVVQVSRDAIRAKGPTLTTFLSVAARTAVLLPSLGRVGVSRRVGDEAVRERLRVLLEGAALPEGVGVVARTAAASAGDEEIARDLSWLVAEHASIQAAAATRPAPELLWCEQDFVRRSVRELLGRSVEGGPERPRIVVDTQDGHERAVAAVAGVSGSPEVRLHTSEVPLLHAHGVEEEIRRLGDTRVPLRGGAFLVIQETEALWAVDVNSGRLRDASSLEETAVQTDLLAAAEIARHIRLRDLGGLIVVDFIDCRDPANRGRVEQAFLAELAKDPARMRVAPMSEFMVVEVTRRRLRRGLPGEGSEPCPCCGGRGRVRNARSVGLAVVRDLRAAIVGSGVRKLCVECSEPVAQDLARRGDALDSLRASHGAAIEIVVTPELPLDRFRVVAG